MSRTSYVRPQSLVHTPICELSGDEAAVCGRFLTATFSLSRLSAIGVQLRGCFQSATWVALAAQPSGDVEFDSGFGSAKRRREESSGNPRQPLGIATEVSGQPTSGGPESAQHALDARFVEPIARPRDGQRTN